MSLQEEQNRTGTKPTQQATQWHTAQYEEDKRGGEGNTKLLINYDNIDTVEKQNILGKIIELKWRKITCQTPRT